MTSGLKVCPSLFLKEFWILYSKSLLSPDWFKIDSKIISPQSPWILLWPFSAFARLLASLEIWLFSSFKFFISVKSEVLCFVSSVKTSFTLFPNIFSWDLNGSKIWFIVWFDFFELSSKIFEVIFSISIFKIFWFSLFWAKDVSKNSFSISKAFIFDLYLSLTKKIIVAKIIKTIATIR